MFANNKPTEMKKTIIYMVAMLALLPLCSRAQMRINMRGDSPLRKLQIAEMAVTNIYVDSVDEEALVENAIRGMLEKLDPHSAYMTAKEVAASNESLQGNFEGIGVQFNMVEDTLLVIQPVVGGPSEKKGIMAGDRIVMVNDSAIAGVKMSREEIMRRLRGAKGTTVRLGIVRRGIKDLLHFTIVRDKIPVKTIDASYMIRPGIGYIRIGSFGAQTHDEFHERLKKLLSQGMTSLIIDLQGNGGGYMQSAVEIASELLPAGDLVVYMEGRQAQRKDYYARSNGLFEKGKLAVLIDSYSASAAEIVTGAVQDHDRGMVIGRRSFGKGLVQRPIDLPDGSMIRLTMAHYYTPSGRCIQKPYVKGKAEDYAMDVYNRLKTGELQHADSIHFADSLKYYTLKEHRVVYGGGGIMPDDYVPLDTTTYTAFHREVAARPYIINANLRYVDSHRKALLKEYPRFADFKAHYEVPQSLIDQIVADAAKDNIKPKDDEELRKTLPALRLQLKGLVARDLWDMDEYFSVMNEDNDIVKRAVELLSKPQ